MANHDDFLGYHFDEIISLVPVIIYKWHGMSLLIILTYLDYML